MKLLTFRSTLLPVRLHRHMRVKMVQCAVSLLAALPSAFIHALDFFVAATGTLVLLRTWDRHERIDLRQWVRILYVD